MNNPIKTPKHLLGSVILVAGIGTFLYSVERKSKPEEGKNISRNIAIVGSVLMGIGSIVLFVNFKN